MFPEDLVIRIDRPINDFIDWLVTNYGAAFEAGTAWLLWVLVRLEGLLIAMPWWLTIALICALAWGASRRASLTAGVGIAMLLVGVLGLWNLAMQTLALMIVSTGLCVMIGIPIGIALSRSARARLIVTPILDAMQTLPVFVYLIPAVMLFGLGKVPAMIATLIYAMPPVIRLTDLGLRQVDRELTEAADAFGATARQKLIGVELPLALPSIMAGINQTTMMALSMVVVASMIGARGLGEEVLRGIQTLDAGQGLTAGIGIVCLAIVLDRTSQAYGRRLDAMRRDAPMTVRTPQARTDAAPAGERATP